MSNHIRYDIDQIKNNQKQLHRIGKEVNHLINDEERMRGTGEITRIKSPQYVNELEQAFVKLENYLINIDHQIDELYRILIDGKIILEEKNVEIKSQYDPGMLR